MTHARRTYTPAEELALTTQVSGLCPLCGEGLFYTKSSKSFKAYELAHIYPLNPAPEEALELDGVEWLHADVNDPDNIIPLCDGCHKRYDKPRTRAEYEQLALLKRSLLEKSVQRALMNEYPLEADLRHIVSRLHRIDVGVTLLPELELTAKRLDDKFDHSMPNPTRMKIRHGVTDYYQHIRREFRDLERDTPNASEVIYAQVRAYYLKQKSLCLSQPAVFNNVVEWFVVNTKPQTKEAAEIMASFFVQNCEVFE